jgi:hypothetical protein
VATVAVPPLLGLVKAGGINLHQPYVSFKAVFLNLSGTADPLPKIILCVLIKYNTD